MTDIHERFGDLLHNLDVWLHPQAFARAVFDRGSPLTDCWGFIDGTARPICRPVKNQRIMFSGHKRTHCLKFQVCQNFRRDSNLFVRQAFFTYNSCFPYIPAPLDYAQW